MNYILVFIIGFSLNVSAKDFGVFGTTFAITEENLIDVLKQEAANLSSTDLQQKAIAKVKEPAALDDLSKAMDNRVFYYDPSFIVQENEYDAYGKLLFIKGQKINPLDKITLDKQLVFFDAREEMQVDFIRALDIKKSKLILTGGSPDIVSNELKTEVFFDQHGLTTSKLGIKHVPAIVGQEDKLLRIKEVKLDD